MAAFISLDLSSFIECIAGEYVVVLPESQGELEMLAVT